jgi:cytochrome oxidase Cu insertion factor (SCO1/SenC/PrrC family)
MSGAAPKRSNASLWLIIALAAAPVAASYLVYFFWAPARTVNYGELIKPRPLPDPQLALADGTAFRLSQLRGKWVLVSLDSGRCDERCEKKLLYMRQLRLTQGKDMERVERAWLLLDDVTPRPDAAARYAGTWLVRAAGAGLPHAFPAPAAATDHIYVVDPLGNLMMRFPPDPEPARMIKDLSRLLKASRIG